MSTVIKLKVLNLTVFRYCCRTSAKSQAWHACIGSTVGISSANPGIPVHLSNPEITGLSWLNPGISGLKQVMKLKVPTRTNPGLKNSSALFMITNS